MKLGRKAFDYFERLVDMSLYALEAVGFLKGMHPDNLRDEQVRVQALERKSGEAKRDVAAALAREFLPPLEREDLFALACAADEIVKKASDAADALGVTGGKIGAGSEEISALAVKCCETAVECFGELKNFKRSETLQSFIDKLNALGEKGRKMCAEAVCRLSGTASAGDCPARREMLARLEAFFGAVLFLAKEMQTAVLKNL